MIWVLGWIIVLLLVAILILWLNIGQEQEMRFATDKELKNDLRRYLVVLLNRKGTDEVERFTMEVITEWRERKIKELNRVLGESDNKEKPLLLTKEA
jgi:predicted Holliday junction resolvase-like endonuclease